MIVVWASAEVQIPNQIDGSKMTPRVCCHRTAVEGHNMATDFARPTISASGILFALLIEELIRNPGEILY